MSEVTLGQSNGNMSGMAEGMNDPNGGGPDLFFHLTSKKNKTKVVKAITRIISNDYKWLRNLKSFWLSQDLFGKRVELTFKGKRSYNTGIGAFISVIIKAILLFFIFYEFYVIFSKKHPAVSYKERLLSDVPDEANLLNIFDKGLNVAIGLRVPTDIALTHKLEISEAIGLASYDINNFSYMPYIVNLPADIG
jgi:hypothetical protein